MTSVNYYMIQQKHVQNDLGCIAMRKHQIAIYSPQIPILLL